MLYATTLPQQALTFEAKLLIGDMQQ